ncbi:MAG: hypothetical protein LUG89_00990 [Methanosphaera sp.]|nr:hypothetical protein [Methanosphaera sp.]
MATFFQKLRDIQNKERSTGTLSEIDDTFYDDASNYLQELLKVVDRSPLSLEAYQLRDAQRITVEIRERREFKIITTALSKIQKDHDLFKDNDDNSKLYDEVPYNVTPEEETLYKSVIDVILENREGLLTDIKSKRSSSKESNIGFKADMPKTKPPKKTSKKPDEGVSDSNQKVVDNKPNKSIKKSSKPQIDESQIALMFGQAPDDVLLDEDNNPIVTHKKKTDITTPFTPPEVPEDDSITLQNESLSDDDKQVDTTLQMQKPRNTQQTQDNTIVEDNTDTQGTTIDEGMAGSVDETNMATSDAMVESVDESSVDGIDYSKDVLVEFNKKISTDILDVDEKTYGPFEKQDIALLPGSLVRILSKQNVISILG